MSKTFIGDAIMSSVRIGDAGGRRNVRPCRYAPYIKQFSDVHALKVVMVAQS